MIERLAGQIAEKIYSHNSDREKKEDLYWLLLNFATEIKRSAVGP